LSILELSTFTVFSKTHRNISVLFPTKCRFFHCWVLFGSYNINIFCKPCTKISRASKKNVVCDGGLLPFKSQCKRVNFIWRPILNYMDS